MKQKEHRQPPRTRERHGKCVSACVWRADRGHCRAHNVASSRSAWTADAPSAHRKRQSSSPPACHALTRTRPSPDEPKHAHTDTPSPPPVKPTRNHNRPPHPVKVSQPTLTPGRRHRSTHGPHAAGPYASSCGLWTSSERPRRFLAFQPLTSSVCASEVPIETGNPRTTANATAKRQCPCFVGLSFTSANKCHYSACATTSPRSAYTPVASLFHSEWQCAPHKAHIPHRRTSNRHSPWHRLRSAPSLAWDHPLVASNRTAASHTPSDCHRRRWRRGVHIGPRTGHTPPTHAHHLAACGPAPSARCESWRLRRCRRQAQNVFKNFRPQKAEKPDSKVRGAVESSL